MIKKIGRWNIFCRVRKRLKNYTCRRIFILKDYDRQECASTSLFTVKLLTTGIAVISFKNRTQFSCWPSGRKFKVVDPII
jgi:hypothetical protein